MQWLTPIPEDAGLQRLKADNASPANTRAVDAVAPYPSSATGNEPKTPEPLPTHERRRGERRRHERRRKQVPVLLDTRSKHDRRAIGDRRQAAEQPPSPRRRIDLYA